MKEVFKGTLEVQRRDRGCQQGTEGARVPDAPG